MGPDSAGGDMLEFSCVKCHVLITLPVPAEPIHVVYCQHCEQRIVLTRTGS
jgi:hypothetical protein